MPVPEGAAREARSPVGSLAAVLLEARKRNGLSQRELAALLGLGKGTIHAAEGARDPRHSTLNAYVRHLPGLDARHLFPGLPPCPPLASPAAWLAAAEEHGLTAERVSFTVSLDADRDKSVATLEIKGVKPFRTRPDDEATRYALMAAISHDSPAVAELIQEASTMKVGRLQAMDEGTCHEFILPESLADTGLTYRRGGPLDAPDLTALQEALPRVGLDLKFPTHSLEITIRLPEGEEARDLHCLAWPQGASADAGLARFLHPRGVDLGMDESRSELHLEIDRPLPVLRYALAWSEREQAQPPAEQGTVQGHEQNTEDRDLLARTLRRAREAAGLGLRQLARRMQVSQTTVRDVELGREPRWSTLHEYLLALPEELSPQALFSAKESVDPPMSREQLWTYYRDLIGFEAEEIVKTLEIASDGSSQTDIATNGLHPTRTDLHDLRVRHGVASVLQVGASILEEIETEEGVLNRTDAGRHGSVQHQLRIPRAIGRAGLSHVRRFKGVKYFLTGQAVHEATGGPPPYMEGSGLPLMHPVKSLKLRVLFPEGYEPEEVLAFMLPQSLVPDPDEMADWGTPLSLLHGKKAGRLTVSAEVEYPIPGFRILLLWVLPPT